MKLINRLLISSVSILLLSALAGCASMATVTHSQPGTTTTIILTRHADRDFMASALNEKGLARAEALVKAVGGMPITAIYSPDLKRNLDTARPLAKHLGIKINVVPIVMRQVATTILTEHPGEVVLWVGNTNNRKDFFELLGGEGAAPIVYGDLYIMEIQESGDPAVTRLRYGSA